MGPAYWRTQQMTQQQTPHAAMGHDQSISGNCAVCYITDSSDDPRLCVYRTLPSAHGLIGRCKEGICRCLKFGFGQISRAERSFSPKPTRVSNSTPSAAAWMLAPFTALRSVLQYIDLISWPCRALLKSQWRACPRDDRPQSGTGIFGSMIASAWVRKITRATVSIPTGGS